MKTKTNLEGLLYLNLKVLYDIESEIIKALPAMIKNATHPNLKTALDQHFSETQDQALRIEKAIGLMGEDVAKIKVDGIRGIIDDAKLMMKNLNNPEAIDASIIAAGSQIEHYEMACYLTAIEWAKLLGHAEVATLLTETLTEEMAAEEKLSELATSSVNELALDVSDEDED